MKIADESTIISNNGLSPEQVVKEEQSTSNVFWRGVVIGGVPGLLLGSASSVFASSRVPEGSEADVEEEVKPEEVEDVDEVAVLKEEVAALKEEVSELKEDLEAAQASRHIHTSLGAVDVAHGVNDDMSFSEAFATARAEVGPGGIFTWHGNVYGTYYANEWNNMTDAEKAEYSQAVHNTNYSADDVQSIPNHSENSDYHEVSNEESEIKVLDTETVETEDGLINVAKVEIDGHYGEIYDLDNDGTPDAALIDSNDDGRPDVAMVDENGDGVIDEHEVHVDPNLQMEMLYDDMPDYSNDADASSFV